MSGIVGGALTAHPPVLIPEVGGRRTEFLKSTTSSLRQLDQRLSRIDFDLLIVMSPHSPSSQDSIPMRRAPWVNGDLSRFGAPQVRVSVEVDLDASRELFAAANGQGFALSWSDDPRLDHGTVVPLYFLASTMTGRKYIFLGISGWQPDRFREFGSWLHRHLHERKALLIASGDLSHRLSADAPYGFRPEGQILDSILIEALRSQQWERIGRLDPALVEEAGECGLRPLSTLIGAAEAAGLRSDVLSYESPFGVGYPVVYFGSDGERLSVQQIGREAIETYLRERRVIEPPASVPPDLAQPSAAFVTLRKHGELRGCMGSLVPTEASAAREIIRYAIASAIRDPRFEPVDLDEVQELTVSAQLLEAPEIISSVEDLDPAVYGVIARSGDRQALLLPAIQGIETPAQQLAAVCEKAGINHRGPLTLQRFRTRTLT